MAARVAQSWLFWAHIIFELAYFILGLGSYPFYEKMMGFLFSFFLVGKIDKIFFFFSLNKKR
ncbi:hypothetical protein RchiOBHm_Chr1g0380801 [Rosa chinensis]|uniref:Uncharacterized protein n=1 Tax=Rosa chinensis TaxID=74649 RepID=A0A2P6SNX5_ROSCH|nr:hypothetical protein RchiOBHm_Chr1g0380801 [Rosa chinensis]